MSYRTNYVPYGNQIVNRMLSSYHREDNVDGTGWVYARSSGCHLPGHFEIIDFRVPLRQVF